MVDHATTDDEDVVRLGEVEGFVDRGDDGDPGVVNWDVGEDDVFAVGERFAEIAENRFVGVFAHEDGFAGGDLLEIFEVGREVPREFVSDADDAVSGDSGDD